MMVTSKKVSFVSSKDVECRSENYLKSPSVESTYRSSSTSPRLNRRKHRNVPNYCLSDSQKEILQKLKLYRRELSLNPTPCAMNRSLVSGKKIPSDLFHKTIKKEFPNFYYLNGAAIFGPYLTIYEAHCMDKHEGLLIDFSWTKPLEKDYKYFPAEPCRCEEFKNSPIYQSPGIDVGLRLMNFVDDCYARNMSDNSFESSIDMDNIEKAIRDLDIPIYTQSLEDLCEPQVYIPGLTDFVDAKNEFAAIAEDLCDRIPEQQERENWRSTISKLGDSVDGATSVFSSFANLSKFFQVDQKTFDAIKKPTEVIDGKFDQAHINVATLTNIISLVFFLTQRTRKAAGMFICTWLFSMLINKKFEFDHFVSPSVTLAFRLIKELLLRAKSEREWKQQCQVEEEIEMTEVQAGIGQEEYDSTLEIVAQAVMGYVCVNKSRDGVTAVSNFLKDYSRMRTGIADFSMGMLRLMENLVNISRRKFVEDGCSLPSVRFLKSNHEACDQLFADIRAFCYDFNCHKISPSRQTLMRVTGLLEACKKIRIGLPKDKFSASIHEMLSDDARTLRNIQTTLERKNISFSGFRQEPAVLEFKGGPGIGKSVSMQHAGFAAVAKVATEEDKKEFEKNPGYLIYTCFPENEYLDGFKQNHLVVNMDDFGQSKDVVGQPDNEYMKLIRMANGFEYYPHMASIEDKGSVTFQAPFIIMSTNQVVYSPQSIISSEALYRRIDHSYTIVPKEEYTLESTLQEGFWKRKLDSKKLPVDPETGNKVLRPEFLLYYRTDRNGRTYGDPLTFDKVIDLWFETYEKKKANFEQNQSDFKGTFEKYSSLYSDNSPPPDDYECTEVEYELEEVLPQGRPSAWTSYHHNYYDAVGNPALDQLVWYHIDPFIGPYDMRTHVEDHVRQLEEVGIDNEVFCSLMRGERPMTEYVPAFRKVVLRKKVSILQKIDFWLEHNIPYYSNVKDFVTKYAKPIAGVFGIIALLGIGKYLLTTVPRWLFGLDFEAESFGHSDKMKGAVPRSAKVYGSHAKMQSFIAKHDTVAQFGNDENGKDILTSLTRTNLFSLEKLISTTNRLGDIESRFVRMGSILVLRDRVALMPFHFIGSMAEGLEEDPSLLNIEYRLSRPGKRQGDYVSYKVRAVDILKGFRSMEEADVKGKVFAPLVKKDLVLVQLPMNVQPCRDITEYIVRNETLNKDPYYFDAMLINNNDKMIVPATYHNKPISVDGMKIMGETWSLRDLYKYNAPTSAGDCGSIFGKLDPTVAKTKIYGMHVSGSKSSNFGFASAFVYEEIMQELNFLFPKEVADIVPQIATLEEMPFELLGRVPNPPTVPTKSEIRKSPLFNWCSKAKTVPSLLHEKTVNGKKIDPWINAIAKYNKTLDPVTPQDMSKLLQGVDLYMAWIADITKIRFAPRLLTLSESVHGIENDLWLGPVPSGTSAGYPMNAQGGRNLKKMLFANERDTPEYMEVFNEIQVEFDLLEFTYRSGKRAEWLYVDYLKDERRPLEKVLEGKTRMFSGGPFLMFLLFRKYFGWFDSHYKSGRIENWSAIGVNPYSSEWGDIAKKMHELQMYREITDVMCKAGDYSGFDTNQMPEVHKEIVKCINNYFYTGADPVDNMVRELLFMEIYNSKHIFLGDIVEWSHALPSGNPMTAIINTIYNASCLVYCFLCVREEQQLEYIRPEDFHNHMYAIILGDDNAISTDDLLDPYLNELTLPVFLKRINMIYTNELKGVAEYPSRPITEISFLKRGWQFDERIKQFKGPLDLDVALEICMWTKTGSDYMMIAATNLENTLNELSLHHSSVWNEYAPCLIEGAKQEYPHHKWVVPLHTSQFRRMQITMELQQFY